MFSHRQPVPRLPLVVALVALVAVMTACGAMAAHGQEKGGIDLTGPYDAVPNWLKPVDKGRLLYPISVYAESPDRVFIASVGTTPTPPPGVSYYGNFDPKTPGARVDRQLIVVNRNGEMIEDWSQWSRHFGQLHAVTMDPYDSEKHVWVVDRESQQVLKFSNDGKRLVRAWGVEGVAGTDEKHFGRPADIAWAPDGSFYVADGYQNNRVVKFAKDGSYLFAWGTEGSAPGQFRRPHGIAVDRQGRVYVVDRNNRRIQLFDPQGRFIEEWPGFSSPTRVWVTDDQFVWVSESGTSAGGGANRLLKYSRDGTLLTYFGTQGTATPGMMAGPHGMSVDSAGNLYLSNGLDQRVDKYVPKTNADRSRLVGPLSK